jgi:hypothetical protein
MAQAHRKSYHSTHKIYFFTASIHKRLPFVAQDNNPQLIVEYLKELSGEGFITVYAFVLMPNFTSVRGTRNVRLSLNHVLS